MWILIRRSRSEDGKVEGVLNFTHLLNKEQNYCTFNHSCLGLAETVLAFSKARSI
jgi:hypothetical protein